MSIQNPALNVTEFHWGVNDMDKIYFIELNTVQLLFVMFKNVENAILGIKVPQQRVVM